MTDRILLADGDPEMLDALGHLLRREGYDVMLARDGVEALHMWEVRGPALMVLEVDLPRLGAREVCRHVRRQSRTRIILIGSATDDATIAGGLDLGADDYVTTPFSPGQLLARIRAVLRRTGADPSPNPGRAHQIVGDHQLDPQFRTVERRGEVLILTPTEFKLLSELVSHEGQVLTHQVLMDRVWGYLEAAETSVIKGQIYNLRHKLETDPAHPVYIQTIPGAGYSFHRREPSLGPSLS